MSKRQVILLILMVILTCTIYLGYRGFQKVTTFDISHFVTADLAASLSKQDTILNSNPPAMDLGEVVVYQNVDTKLLDRILISKPSAIWKTCQPFTAQDTCTSDWLTMNQMWHMTAKVDPRSDAPTQSYAFKKMIALEDNPSTRCSLVASTYQEDVGGVPRTAVVMSSGIVYLCVNKDLRLVQVEAWST